MNGLRGVAFRGLPTAVVESFPLKGDMRLEVSSPLAN